jgi:hypothetical protein
VRPSAHVRLFEEEEEEQEESSFFACSTGVLFPAPHSPFPRERNFPHMLRSVCSSLSPNAATAAAYKTRQPSTTWEAADIRGNKGSDYTALPLPLPPPFMSGLGGRRRREREGGAECTRECSTVVAADTDADSSFPSGKTSLPSFLPSFPSPSFVPQVSRSFFPGDIPREEEEEVPFLSQTAGERRIGVFSLELIRTLGGEKRSSPFSSSGSTLE